MYVCRLVVVAALGCVARGASEAGLEAPRDEPDDDESDSAPFTVLVEAGGGGGRACGGALVSLRTALTSARCARAVSPAGELWARVPPPARAPAVRVLRVAYAAGAAPEGTEGGEAWSASAAGHDLALLELEASLEGARPILLAASRADCDPADGAGCYLVRALGRGRSGRLRIVELAAKAASACWPRSGSVRAERALCLAGTQLCQGDRGAGVVCGGKLCGVLSASRGVGAGAAGAAEECGAPHAAAAVPAARRFLHCAHTRGACGRDGECVHLCSERWLVDETAPHAPPTPFAAADMSLPLVEPAPPASSLPYRTIKQADVSVSEPPSSAPPPTHTPPASPPTPTTPPPLDALASTQRHALEFEPNRADFTMVPMVLKAGEYGDNAADYAPPPPPAELPPAPLATPPAPPSPPVPPAVQARVSGTSSVPRAATARAPRAAYATSASATVTILLYSLNK